MNLTGPDLQIVIKGDVDLDLPFRWEQGVPITIKPGPQTIKTAILVDNPNDVAVPIPSLTGTPSSAIIKSFETDNAVELPKQSTGNRVPVTLVVEGEHGQAVTLSGIKISAA